MFRHYWQVQKRERRLNRLRIQLSVRNWRKISALKGIHKSQQCVVLATGPSVTDKALSLMEGHPYVLGVNGAYLARPSFAYYFCSAGDFFAPNQEKVEAVDARLSFFSDQIKFKPHPKYVYLRLHGKNLARAGRFEPNLHKMLHWGPTVVLDLVLPVALWMGFSEILLVGADYSTKKYRHFYAREQHRSLFKGVPEDEFVWALKGFEILVQHLRDTQSEVKIYNCSPSSALECFEKAPLSEVIRVEDRRLLADA